MVRLPVQESATCLYAVYYLAVWLMVRRIAPVAPGRLQLVVVLVATALVMSNVLLESQPVVTSALFGLVAIVLAAVAWPRMWRLHRAGEL